MATTLFEFLAQLVTLSFSAFAGGVLLLQARALRDSFSRVAYPGISIEQLAAPRNPD